MIIFSVCTSSSSWPSESESTELSSSSFFKFASCRKQSFSCFCDRPFRNFLSTSASCSLSAFCISLCQHQATFANTFELPSLCIQGQTGKRLSWIFSGTTDKHSQVVVHVLFVQRFFFSHLPFRLLCIIYLTALVAVLLEAGFNVAGVLLGWSKSTVTINYAVRFFPSFGSGLSWQCFGVTYCLQHQGRCRE